MCVPAWSTFEVAGVYISSDAPVKAVAKHFGVSYSTAAKRVAAARRDGWLPPVKKGGNNGKPRECCPTCGAPPSRQRDRSWRNATRTL